MNNISMIACVGANLELGKDNKLIWHIPYDLRYFKRVTSGKTVVMGRKTFESLPGALPKRRNIVLQHANNVLPGAYVFNSVDDILDDVKDEDEVFIIGGASIYKQFLPYANRLYLTEVMAECKDCDVYFPKFDKTKYKKRILEKREDNNLKYNFVIYEKK